MRISKYEGLGNSFIVTTANELISSGLSLNADVLSELAKKICDKNFGIGADDFMLLATEAHELDIFSKYQLGLDFDCLMLLINQDGTLAEMSGNGIRCFASFAKSLGLGTEKDNNVTININTLAGIKTVEIEDDENGFEHAKVDMGPAIYDPNSIPLNINEIEFKIEVLGKQRNSFAVNTGIPHWVIVLDSIDELWQVDLEQIGKQFRFDNRFPNNTNVNFVYIENKKIIHGRTIERGVGETLACGTGMSAMVATLNKNALVNAKCEVKVKGGISLVEVTDETIYLYGPMNKLADIDFSI